MSDYPMLISNKLHSFRNFFLQIYKKIIKESHKPIKKAANGSFFTICSYFLFI